MITAVGIEVDFQVQNAEMEEFNFHDFYGGCYFSVDPLVPLA